MRTILSFIIVSLALSVVPACVVGDDGKGDTKSDSSIADWCANYGIPQGVEWCYDLPPNDGGGGGGGGGGGSVNQCTSQVNEKAVTCTNGACECKINGVVQSTCTAANGSSGCSIPGNCCGY